MEDDNGLELSLGLGCGGLSSKSTAKGSIVSDDRIEEVETSNKVVVGDFKNFLYASAKKQDSVTGSLKSDSVKPPDTLYNNHPRSIVDIDSSINLFSAGNRSMEAEDNKRLDAGNKRKMLFDDKGAHLVKKASHISITTDDGSTADNEDVAESEVDGLTSRLSSHHDGGSKQFRAGLGAPEVPKDFLGFSGSVQKTNNNLLESEYKPGNLTFGVSFSGRPVNVMSTPYSFTVKESNGTHTPSSSSHPLTGMTQVVATPNGEQRAGTQSADPGNLPVLFGYSPVQLPTLDKDNSRGLISNPQQFHLSYAGRSPSNSGAQVLQVFTRNETDSTLEDAKSDSKQLVPEEASSSQAEDDAKGNSFNLRPKAPVERPMVEGLSIDFSAIRPGIAADLKFGGSGSYPNLPWVSTTAPGPNGRTISGVTYRYGAAQIRIVCACHGSHMSPEEFVRHASEETANPTGGGSCLATFANKNPPTSAQS